LAESFERASFALADPAPLRWSSQRQSVFPRPGARRGTLDRVRIVPSGLAIWYSVERFEELRVAAFGERAGRSRRGQLHVSIGETEAAWYPQRDSVLAPFPTIEINCARSTA
jgi:hypothetical protein